MSDQDLQQSYSTELRRGSLAIAVLGCLRESYYGYSLLQKLESVGLPIEANTLYPLLRRLETQGLLTSDWDTSQNRPRKYYLISEKGIRVYDNLCHEWERMQESLDLIRKENKE